MKPGDTKNDETMLLIATDAERNCGRLTLNHPRHGRIQFERRQAGDGTERPRLFHWVALTVERPSP